MSDETGLSDISHLTSVNGTLLLCLVRLVCLASIILLMLTADFASTGEIGTFSF